MTSIINESLACKLIVYIRKPLLSQSGTGDLLPTKIINISKHLIFCLLLLVMDMGSAKGQVVGDYGTRYTSGTYFWNTTINWVVCVTNGQWTDATVATTVPGNTNNVWIRTGSIYSMDASIGYCKNLTINGTLTDSNSNCTLNIGGGLVINNGTLCDINSNKNQLTLNVTGDFTVNGTASIQSVYINIAGMTMIVGTINFEIDPTGTKTFKGLVYLFSGGAWNNTDNQPIFFEGGITNYGVFNAGNGPNTFDTKDQTLTGNLSIPNLTITGITLTNTNNLSVSNSLSGSGGLTQGANATLNIGGTSTITTLTANASGNTVNYSGGAQIIKPSLTLNYSNLTLSGSGTKTTTGVTVNGILSMEGDGTVTVTVLPGYVNATTLQYKGTAPQITGLEFPSQFKGIGGVIINNSSGVTLNGTKIISNTTGTTGTLAILNGASLSLGTFSCNAISLTLGGSGQPAGTWGGIESSAFFKNGTYFGPGVGILTIATKSCSSGLWTGATSTDWDTGTNWCDGSKPTSSTDVTINPWGYQPIIGGNATCRNITIISGASLSITGTNTLTIGGSFSNSGSFTANASTVIYNTAAQTVGVASYYHLTLSGSGVKTLKAGIMIGGNLTLSFISGAVITTTTVADLTIGGNLNIGDKTSFNVAGFNFTVLGKTTIGGGFTGGLSFNSITGNKIFTGLVTINNGAGWINTINSPIEFQGGITSFTPSLLFQAGSGVQSFTINPQVLTGTFTIPNVTITGVALTNNNILTVGSILTGSGGLTQAAGATLNLGGSASITSLDATGIGNTVNYSGNDQNIKTANYYHLILLGTNCAKKMQGATITNGNLTINSGITLNTSDFSLTFGGDFINNGTFLNAGSSSIVITGSAATQNISGFITTGPLSITKSSGTATLSGVVTTGSITIGSGILNLGTITTHSTSSLIFGSIRQPSGIWGGTGSGASSINTTYFAASAGRLIVSCLAGSWTGTTNNDWNTPSNWCDASVPTSLTNVTINSGGNQPQINTGDALCKDIILNSGATLSLSGTNTLSISGNALNNGTFIATGASTVNYNLSTGGQTVMVGTYSNLIISNISGIQSANGSLIVNGTLTTIAGGTLDMGNSYTLGGALSSITNNGIIKTSVPTSTSPTPIPTGKIWGGEIVYNGTSPQTLAAGTYTNLTIDNAPGVYLSDTITATNVTGSLLIKNGKRIEIGPKAEMSAGSIQNDAGAPGILIKASSNLANGTLIFSGNAPQASVEMYSKASWNLDDPDNDNRYKWQYFGIPAQSVVANPTFNGSYVRKWNEAGTKSASDYWLQLGNSSVLTSFQGYELCQESPTILVFKGQLENGNFDSGPMTYTDGAKYQGQHIFANPYTAGIDVRNLTFGTGTEATVYLYNTGSLSQWTSGGQTSPVNGPGQYTAIPKIPAGDLGIPYEVPSMQAMLVKAMNNSSNATFSFSYSAVITKNTVEQRIKSSNQTESSDKVCTVIDVKGTNYSDRMWIFTDRTCSHHFDNGWDGTKLLGSALSPHIYAVETDGNYQVDAVDDMNNTCIGFLPGQDVSYTFTFTQSNVKNNYAGIYLRDNVENKTIDITVSGSVYSFLTETGSQTANRFTIITRPYEKNTPEDSALKMFSGKNTILIQNLSNLNGEVMIYDIAGHYLKKESLPPSGITAITDIIPGAYVAKAFTSEVDVTKRLIVQ